MAQRIGIFGGSFNPPHVGHLVVAERIREQHGLDRVFWIPAYVSPHKSPDNQIAASHRLAMTKLAIASNEAFDALSLEVDRAGTSYTIDTIRDLLELYPEHQFSLIIGEDNLHSFMEWHKPHDIVDLVPLIVYRRHESTGATGAQAATLFADRISYAEAPLLEISSTSIRNRIKHGQSVRYVIPDCVLAYIKQHSLYI